MDSTTGAMSVAALVILGTFAFSTSVASAASPLPWASVLEQATDEPFEDIAITVDGLEPPIVAVPVGSAVRWTNKTEQIHNTTHLPEIGMRSELPEAHSQHPAYPWNRGSATEGWASGSVHPEKL